MSRKLFCSCKDLYNGSPGVSSSSRALSYSTKSVASSAPTDTLYSRITPGVEPRASIVPILDQWVSEGRAVEQADLQKIIRQLRKYKRFNHALEISQWMTDKRYLDLLPADVAVRLDLISKVHGLKQAEEYFNSISNTFNVFQIYGALLNCYARARSVEKAEATMQKMRDLGYAKTLSYNVMLNLYSQIGQHEKLDSLMEEMEEKGITRDKFTYNIRLNAYATVSDIEGMEKLLMKMEEDPLLTMDWNAYVVAANGYVKAASPEKALPMLKKAEQLIRGKTRFGYELLLTLYANMGKKADVYRMWNLYKNSGKVFNTSYIAVLSSLVKMDDLEGAREILEEWEAKKTYFDIRVPNVLVGAYCNKARVGEAESLVNRLIQSGREPNSTTWDRLAFGYYKDNQMAKAAETLKKAILAGHPRWKPNHATLAACLNYMKGEGDVNAAEEFISVVREQVHLSSQTYDRSVDDLTNGNSVPDVLDEMKEDDQVIER